MKYLLVIVMLVGLQGIAAAQTYKPGSKVPNVVLPTADGDSLALGSLKSKKYILVDFWASWCGPCRRAMPGLKKLYSKYNNKGFEIYSISLDENAKAWKQAVFEDGTKWLHVIDRQGNIANAWGVSFIPNTYLLDNHYNVIAVNPDPGEVASYLDEKLGL